MPDNLLLAALPKEERARVAEFLTLVELESGYVMIEPQEPITNIYFPINAVTSTIQELSDGSSIESGLMGVEGMIGIQLWLRSQTTATRTLIQVAGRLYKMKADAFIREVRDRQTPLNDLIARYTHAFLNMTSMVAACNRLHTIDERLCRWLKLTHDRVRRDEFQIRHDFLAQMLGVHRPTVSTAANILQKAGLITYRRGHLKILNSEGLRDGACECLELMETEFDRMFDRPWRELVREQDENRLASETEPGKKNSR